MPNDDRPAYAQVDDIIALCDRMRQLNIWLMLSDDGTRLSVGPEKTIQAHPDILGALRYHKAHLLDLLRTTLVPTVFGGEGNTTTAFIQGECPRCHQMVFLMDDPPRLGGHRLQTGEVCDDSTPDVLREKP